jgi:hypothetical protein
MVRALNMTGLRTLKLWNCPSCIDLLKAIIDANETMNLTTFELVIGLDCHAQSCSPLRGADLVIALFLTTFRGLEDIYIMVLDLEWDVIMEGVRKHDATLRRLVTYNSWGVKYGDSLDGDGKWQNGMEVLHQCRTLVGVGTCMSPSALV